MIIKDLIIKGEAVESFERVEKIKIIILIGENEGIRRIDIK
jgi:hypothetical protein